MKIFEALELGVQKLVDSHLPFSKEEIRELLAHTLGESKSFILLNSSNELTQDQKNNYEAIIEKRSKGYPSAYIIGSKGFYKSDFLVNENVLIPRPETEQIVDLGLGEIKDIHEPMIADFGSGSGCIAISIILEKSKAKALLVDISEKAMEVAKKNAKQLNVDGRTTFLLKPVEELNRSAELRLGSFDLVVSNPPYISTQTKEIESSVKNHEPSVALYGGEKGGELYEPWSQVAYELLKPGALLICEIGYDQGNLLEKVFAKKQLWSEIKVLKDLSGRDRIIVARKAG